ncbi:MAG: FtsH protease activity modulator HflK [Sphingomonadaceae bacterium]|nr:FtsH protease activity modulator HflK [Sphingomonadaceae bacterium]
MSKKIDEQGVSISAVDGKGPWDSPASGDSGKSGKPKASAGNSDAGSKPEPVNPWDPTPSNAPQGGRQRGPSLEDLLRRTGGGKGGGFGGLPARPDGKSWWPLIAGSLIALWIVWTSFHRIGPEQEGVVTFFGKYARTVQPGIQFTLPAPIESLQKIDTKQIQTTAIGSPKASSENLVLTRDQSIIDMAYDVRWSIKDPELYLFQLDNPNGTVKEVAESAMRAAVANFDLTQAIGPGRGAIEMQVRQRMQQVLDEYRSGVLVQSISIRQSDPPAEVNDAFREVNAAQQRRESYLNDARAYASRVSELAIGETAEFDKIYEEYRQAPEVTRTRLYYETMEQVLGKVDKTIVESGGVTPYLPLPEFQRRANAKNEPVTVTGKAQ